MANLILSALYFMLPAYAANMAPVFAHILRLPFGSPVDKKHLGSHKTFRGIYAAYIAALIVLWIQRFIQKQGYWESMHLLDYEELSILLLAFCFGIGAITGDMVKSFFKRLLKIKPGSPWFPFDQIDYVIGALVFLSPVYIIDWKHAATLLLITPMLNIIVNALGYVLRLKKVWW